jgi:hypothetical protein
MIESAWLTITSIYQAWIWGKMQKEEKTSGKGVFGVIFTWTPKFVYKCLNYHF